jgi:hypothetical protein
LGRRGSRRLLFNAKAVRRLRGSKKELQLD